MSRPKTRAAVISASLALAALAVLATPTAAAHDCTTSWPDTCGPCDEYQSHHHTEDGEVTCEVGEPNRCIVTSPTFYIPPYIC